MTTTTLPVERISSKIFLIRDQKVMLDRDLAELYSVETGALNRAVKRNAERFPEDFMFQLMYEEAELLRCQTGISKSGRGGRRYLPYAFSEQGVAMLSSVLNSRHAIEVNIAIMRAFVHLRKMIASLRNYIWGKAINHKTRFAPLPLHTEPFFIPGTDC